MTDLLRGISKIHANTNPEIWTLGELGGVREMDLYPLAQTTLMASLLHLQRFAAALQEGEVGATTLSGVDEQAGVT